MPGDRRDLCPAPDRAAGAPGAVINAINDALAPFNAHSFDQPLTPEKILKALGTI
jgi:carbon-monoxide dehydrogenase large subunit